MARFTLVHRLAVFAILLALSGILLLWLSMDLEQGAAAEGPRSMAESVAAVALLVHDYPRGATDGIRESLSPHRRDFEGGLASYLRAGDSRELRALKIKLERSFATYLDLAESVSRRRDEQSALSRLLVEHSRRLHHLVIEGASEPARRADRAAARARLSRQLLDAVSEWFAYRESLHPESRERALEHAREAKTTLAGLEEADRLTFGAQLDAFMLALQKSQILAEEERGELERFDSVRRRLASDLSESLDERPSRPKWAMRSSAALLLLLAFGSAALAERSRSEARGGSANELSVTDGPDDATDAFISTLLHELRNPLNPILTAVHIMEAEPPTEPRIAHLRDVIGRQARQLERLVEDLLDISRIRRGRVDLKLEKSNLADLIREIAADYEAMFAEGKVQLQVSVPDQPVWVMVDRTRIRQVIGNLLQNAAKFTNPGGRVELQMSPHERHAVFELRDTGIGMGQSTLDAVFEPFSQGKRADDRANTGLGLGMSLVKRLIELHGGDVRAASSGKDQGSEFSVRLPLAN